MMQLVGQNPQAQQIMAALQAHITEHLAFSYRRKIEEKLGAPLPPPGAELPPEVEVELSRLLSSAGQQLTQQNQQQAQQQAAQQQQQDPRFQLEQQKVQIQAQEQQRKSQKDQADAQLKQRQQQHKEQMDAINVALEAKGIQLDRQELELEAEKAGAKLAADKRRDNNRIDLELARLIEQSVSKREQQKVKNDQGGTKE